MDEEMDEEMAAGPSTPPPHLRPQDEQEQGQGQDEPERTVTFAEHDYDLADLDPVITYRHLLSRSSNVKSPLRVIALCDMDAFYAACERVRLGLDPEIPLVVQQWESLIAVNYPARKYGISRMDKISDALKRCPHLKVVHTATYKAGEAEPVYVDNPDTTQYKVSLDYYRSESVKIARKFREYAGIAEVEKASIDEAFFDFSLPVKDEILRRYPHLSQPPPDSPLGQDAPLPPAPRMPFHLESVVIPPDPHAAKEKEQKENVEEGKEEEGEKPPSLPPPEPESAPVILTETWHDVALSIAAEMLQSMRDIVRTELGYTTSAGIARNKFLAKLVASYKKPNSQSILRNAIIPEYLCPVKFQKIRFLGGKLGAEIAKEFEAAAVGDLLTISLDEMQHKFGEGSIWIYEILRGVDRSEVKEKGPINKSMQSSKNLPKPITKYEDGHHWMMMLSAELKHRLTKAREEEPGLWPKTLSLHVSRGRGDGKGKQTPFQYMRNITAEAICAIADKLWKDLLWESRNHLRIIYVSLSFQGVETIGAGQQHISGFLQAKQGSPEKPKSSASVGGNGDGRPISTAKRKRETSTDPPSPSRPPRSKVAIPKSKGKGKEADPNGPFIAEEAMTIVDDDDVEVVESSPLTPPSKTGKTWCCTQCHERLSVDFIEDADIPDEEYESILESMKMVHLDGHFAEQLAKKLNGSGQGGGGSGSGSGGGGGGGSKTKTKTKKEEKDPPPSTTTKSGSGSGVKKKKKKDQDEEGTLMKFFKQ